MKTALLTVRTGHRPVVHDLTPQAAAFVAGEGDGLLNVFVPHATAGVVVIELGAGTEEDLLAAVGTLLPADGRWRHSHGAPGHGRDHVLPAICAPSVTVPVERGLLMLGRWQSLALLDVNVDNPDREVRLSFVAG
ncbi:MAG: YjbQ family protein [Frankia sp.]|nr:YjbQ family protein [Frankia sp.]